MKVWADLLQGHLNTARSATAPRVGLARKAMGAGYSEEDLITFLRWVFRSDHFWAKFMRKPEKPYLELENLLRRRSLHQYLPEARNWAGEGEEEPEGEEELVIQYGDQRYVVGRRS